MNTGEGFSKQLALMNIIHLKLKLSFNGALKSVIDSLTLRLHIEKHKIQMSLNVAFLSKYSNYALH